MLLCQMGEKSLCVDEMPMWSRVAKHAEDKPGGLWSLESTLAPNSRESDAPLGWTCKVHGVLVRNHRKEMAEQAGATVSELCYSRYMPEWSTNCTASGQEGVLIPCTVLRVSSTERG